MPIATTPEAFLSLNALIRARSQSRLPFLRVANKFFDAFSTYSCQQLDTASTLLAHHLHSSHGGNVPIRAKGDTHTKMTAALLAPSGLNLFVHELALLKMGYGVLMLSTNNSPAVNAHLMSSTGTTVLCTHPSFSTNAHESAALCPEDYKCSVILTSPSEVFSRSNIDQAIATGTTWDWALTSEEEAEMPAILMHSSGSTGMPKVIHLPHRRSIAAVCVSRPSGLCTLPLSHMYGHMAIWSTIYGHIHHRTISLYPLSESPLTASNMVKFIELSNGQEKSLSLFAVPFVYKLMSEEDTGIEALKTMAMCEFGGSPLPDLVGDKLVKRGVKLNGTLGSTETGFLATTARDFESDHAWNYYRFSGPYARTAIADYSIFESRGGKGEDEVFELVVKSTWPALTSHNRPNDDFATNDLFSPHPSIPGAWRYLGRNDDTLVLVNGEKSNPIPIEHDLLVHSPYLKDVVVFGHNRRQLGALLVLSAPDFSAKSIPELQALVKPALDLTNAEAQSHSFISPDMLVFLPADTMLPKADKGSIIRKRVYATFAAQIDEAYQKLEAGSVSEEDKKQIGTEQEVKEWLKDTVQKIAGGEEAELKDETDLFDFGLDSLQAERIKAKIQMTFNLCGSKLPSNFVFDHPSISQMAAYLEALSKGTSSDVHVPTQVEGQLALVEKYRHFEGSAVRSTDAPSLAKVVVTGASGSMGAHVLSQLLLDSTVKTVYCLVRAKSNAEATDRVIESLKTRRLQPFDKSDSRIVCLASDTSRPDLGLRPEVFAALEKEVTMVLHLAWSVNFNKTISSFESLIAGAHHLMQLTLRPSHPASFFFSSSISTVLGWQEAGRIPEAVVHPSAALPMGYAGSKWVVERLCEIAHQELGMRANILRVGQIVGGENGVWNETEAIPLLFKSIDTLGALPNDYPNRAWLPVDACASIILETTRLAPDEFTDPNDVPCFHVLQSKNVAWRDVLDSLRNAGLTFEVVKGEEWVRRLRESTDDFERNPTKKLLDYYTGMFASIHEVMPRPDDTLTKRVSPTLENCALVGEEIIRQWVRVWQECSFLRSKKT